MVWRRMGLLDDAIRDHLELKRLRGADPGEVAREQREALEPGLGVEVGAGIDELGAALEDVNPPAGAETAPVRAGGTIAPASAEEHAPSASPALDAEVSIGGEETAELDMQTVMGEHDRASAEGGLFESPAGEGRGGDPSADIDGGDQLEWGLAAETIQDIPADAGDRGGAVGDDGR